MTPGPLACVTVRPDAPQIDEALFHLSLTYPRTAAWCHYANQLLDARQDMTRRYNLDEIQAAYREITGDPSSGTTKELMDAIIAQLETGDEHRATPADKREATTLH